MCLRCFLFQAGSREMKEKYDFIFSSRPPKFTSGHAGMLLGQSRYCAIGDTTIRIRGYVSRLFLFSSLLSLFVAPQKARHCHPIQSQPTLKTHTKKRMMWHMHLTNVFFLKAPFARIKTLRAFVCVKMGHMNVTNPNILQVLTRTWSAVVICNRSAEYSSNIGVMFVKCVPLWSCALNFCLCITRVNPYIRDPCKRWRVFDFSACNLRGLRTIYP
jgi:hypothetical protein